MAKIDKHFLGFSSDYDYLDKKTNVLNHLSYLFNRTVTMFDYNNLPSTIPKKELELLIQSNGFGVFLKINNDYYVVNGGLGGEGDVYNRPTIATVSIPYLKYNKTLKIGEECVIISNDTTKTGLKPMFDKYVNLLTENNISLLLTIINTRLQTIISANDDMTVESAKQYLKDIFDGKMGVIAEQRLFDSLTVNNANTKNNNIVDLIELEQYVKASLYNEIGLSANYNMKKERLINAEVELNNDVLYPLIDDMLDNRKQAIEEINSLYGLNIEVEFSSSWKYKNRDNETILKEDEELFSSSWKYKNRDNETILKEDEELEDVVILEEYVSDEEDEELEEVEEVEEVEETEETEETEEDEEVEETEETEETEEDEEVEETEEDEEVEETEEDEEVEETEELEEDEEDEEKKK